jgi:GDP-mannose 6-dehydrogenase
MDLNEDTQNCITVIGLGRIGCVTAGCLAEIGHRVWGVDSNAARVASVSAGHPPFHENLLQPIIERAVQAGTLIATGDLRLALSHSSVVMICINTEASSTTDPGLRGLVNLVNDILQADHDGIFHGTIVIRSTVPPGTCDQLILPMLRSSGLGLASNPEFLREGSSVKDFMEPSIIVVGGDDPAHVQPVAALYASMACAVTVVGLREAEIIKYACNVFHALKISFANELGDLCSALQIDGQRVMKVLRSDTKLNASPAYLRPGFAFGGYCLPKDTRALNVCARDLGLDLPLLASILPSNDLHLRRAIDAVTDLGVKRIGVYGISFKGGTDDFRESPALTLVNELGHRGIEVRLFDPTVLSVQQNSPSVMVTETILNRLIPSLDAWLGAIDGVALTQTAPPETMSQIRASGLPVLDLTTSSVFAPGLMGAHA